MKIGISLSMVLPYLVIKKVVVMLYACIMYILRKYHCMDHIIIVAPNCGYGGCICSILFIRRKIEPSCIKIFREMHCKNDMF